jgi:hypothetical protein
MDGLCSMHWEIKNANRILVRKTEGQGALERHRQRLEDI